MLKIGLTGSFGSGKSMVAEILRKRGCRVINADELTHEIFREDKTCRRSVARAFGSDMLTDQGVDRVKLGKKVFNDPKALKTLEAIVHPRLRWMIVEDIKSAGCRMVVLDAAILIEAGWHKFMDVVIVVKTRRDIQIRRVMARTGLSKADVLKRIRRQMSLREKMKYAAYVIDNSGSAAQTEKHVERIFRSLIKTPIQQEFSS
jgi:dephospho-CoA kinase